MYYDCSPLTEIEVQYAYLKRFPNHRFGNDGSFWKRKPGSDWLKVVPKNANQPYRQVQIDGKAYALHRLIAEAFYGPRPGHTLMVRHLDDDPSNNALWNLAWGCASMNAGDAVRNGRLAYRRTRWDK